jgi:hypothetical protein
MPLAAQRSIASIVRKPRPSDRPRDGYFGACESGYWGDPYFLAANSDGEEVRLTQNADPMYRPAMDPPEERDFVADHAEFPAVLWLEAPAPEVRELAARIQATVGAKCVVVDDA